MTDFRSAVSWSLSENKREDREMLGYFGTSGCFEQRWWQSTPSDMTLSLFFHPPRNHSVCLACRISHRLSGEGWSDPGTWSCPSLFNSSYNLGIYWVCICICLCSKAKKNQTKNNPTRKKKPSWWLSLQVTCYVTLTLFSIFNYRIVCLLSEQLKCLCAPR